VEVCRFVQAGARDAANDAEAETLIAVPFPFGGEVGRIERGEVHLLDRMRQHRRPERRGVARFRALLAASTQAKRSM
jgi:hypothetical protein